MNLVGIRCTLGVARREEEWAEIVKQFDPKYLGDMSGGDIEFVHDIISTFMETAIDLVDGLEIAGRNQDAEKAIYAAHTLKGSARSVGAAPLGDLCEELEKFAREDDMQGFSELVGQVPVTFDLLRGELTAYIAPRAA